MSTFDTTSTRICSRSCAKNILSHYTRGYSSSWGQHPIIGSDASNTIVHHNAARREPGPQDSLRKALQLTWICKEGTGQKAGADWGWPVEHGAGQFVAASDVCVLGRLMARWRGVNMHHLLVWETSSHTGPSRPALWAVGRTATGPTRSNQGGKRLWSPRVI